MIVVVAGTGTEIGKTTFTCAWLRRMRRRGVRVVGWKPIETGGDSDERALADACGERAPALYRFERPVSPHVEARRTNVRIDRARIVEEARRKEKTAGVLVVETAGGLFSPLDDEGGTNAELVADLGGHRVLVAPNRLGVLHDVEACRRAVGEDAKPAALILTTRSERDESQSSNADELRMRMPNVPVIVGDFLVSDEPLAPLDDWTT